MTKIQSFNKDPFKAFERFLNWSHLVESYEDEGEYFTIVSNNSSAKMLQKEFVEYLADPNKVRVSKGYDESAGAELVTISPTKDRWRKVILTFEDMPQYYEYGGDIAVSIEDVF